MTISKEGLLVLFEIAEREGTRGGSGSSNLCKKGDGARVSAWVTFVLASMELITRGT